MNFYDGVHQHNKIKEPENHQALCIYLGIIIAFLLIYTPILRYSLSFRKQEKSRRKEISIL